MRQMMRGVGTWMVVLIAMVGCRSAVAGAPVQPYRTGYLAVGDGHEIFYQLGGNSDGVPVMVLHGGPGGSCTPDMFHWFDLSHYHVILHDQRGCGKSRPRNRLVGNTTQALVSDIEKLRVELGLGRVMLFGGSWGSTLALAYAETYPDHVAGMVLRGVFTAAKDEIDHFYHGGTAAFFPEVWEDLRSTLDHPDRLDYPQQLLQKLQSDDAEVRRAAARAWAGYEIRLVSIDMTGDRTEAILDRIGPDDVYTFSLMENWYMAHNCFLEDGQLLQQADRLAGIPIIMVQGRYDLICRPLAAWRLHKKLPGSKLRFARLSGHSSHEPEIDRLLQQAMKELESVPVQTTPVARTSVTGRVEEGPDGWVVVVNPDSRSRVSYRLTGIRAEQLAAFRGRTVKVTGTIRHASPWSGVIAGVTIEPVAAAGQSR